MKEYKDYLEIAGNVHLAYYVEAAEILGIDYEIIVHRLTAKFSYNGKHWFINNTAVPVNNAPSSNIAKRKNIANSVLKKAGVPVPEQELVETDTEVLNFFQRYRNIVLKPVSNLGGKGVSILPKTVEDLRQAFLYAKENDKKGRVLAEEFIDGINYRILTIGDEVISVVKRLPAHITGDGQNDIKTLIKISNQTRAERMLMAIPIDTETTRILEQSGRTLETIPTNGEYVPLRMNANLTTGGTTEEVKDIVHDYYKEIAVNTLKALDLQFAGIDLITPDITQPVNCAINEVNYNPGLRIHYKVENGEPQKVAVRVMEYIRDWYTKTSSKEDIQ